MTWLDYESQRSRSEQAYVCGGEGIHINAGASKSVSDNDYFMLGI